MGPTTTADSFLNAVQFGARSVPTSARATRTSSRDRASPTWPPPGRWSSGRGGRDGLRPVRLMARRGGPRRPTPGSCGPGTTPRRSARTPSNQTRKSVAYAESRDGGRTFTKPGYPDNQVVRSPTDATEGQRTGRGDTSMVRRGKYFYMYYQEVLPDFSIVTSVARATVASGRRTRLLAQLHRGRRRQGSWTATRSTGRRGALNVKVGASSASVHTASDEVCSCARTHPAAAS